MSTISHFGKCSRRSGPTAAILTAVLCSLTAPAISQSNSTVSALDKAERMLNQDHPDSAKGIVEDVLKQEPRNSRAWYLLGSVNQELTILTGTNDAARNCYMRALALDPNYGEPYRKLGELAGTEGNWQEEIRLSNKALACPGANQYAWRNRAIANSNLHKDADALKDYEKYLTTMTKEKAEKVDKLDTLATFQENAGHFDDSMKTLQKMETMYHPRNMELRKAKLLSHAGKNLESIAILDKLVTPNSDDSTILTMRAKLLAKIGKTKEAIRDYSQAIDIEPTKVSYLGRAALYELTGEHAKAMADKRKADDL